MKQLLIIVLLLFSEIGFAQDKPLFADIDCNGKKDKAEVIQTKEKVWLVITLDSGEKSVISFGLGNAEAQNTLCGTHTVLELSDLPDVSDANGENPEGYIPSSVCSGLTLSAGSCDPINVYWNHNTNNLSWWRM